MSSLPSQQAPSSPLHTALAPLGVVIEDEEDIGRYLQQHPGLLWFVLRVCEAARREFGAEASLALAVYHDPEIVDEYLSLKVMLADYPPDFMPRLRSVTDEHEDALANTSGFLLVTTDFRPPQ